MYNQYAEWSRQLKKAVKKELDRGLLGVLAAKTQIPEGRLRDWVTMNVIDDLSHVELNAIQDVLAEVVLYRTTTMDEILEKIPKHVAQIPFVDHMLHCQETLTSILNACSLMVLGEKSAREVHLHARTLLANMFFDVVMATKGLNLDFKDCLIERIEELKNAASKTVESGKTNTECTSSCTYSGGSQQPIQFDSSD